MKSKNWDALQRRHKHFSRQYSFISWQNRTEIRSIHCSEKFFRPLYFWTKLLKLKSVKVPWSKGINRFSLPCFEKRFTNYRLDVVPSGFFQVVIHDKYKPIALPNITSIWDFKTVLPGPRLWPFSILTSRRDIYPQLLGQKRQNYFNTLFFLCVESWMKDTLSCNWYGISRQLEVQINVRLM